MNKTALSESDICDRFITPAIERAGWTSDKWRREFSFTDGKMIVRGKMVARGKPRRGLAGVGTELLAVDRLAEDLEPRARPGDRNEPGRPARNVSDEEIPPDGPRR